MTTDIAADARLLDPIREHLAAEAARDIEWTLRTVTEDCRYDFPFQALTICGRRELRDYYAMLFASRPGATLHSDIRRYWISGADTVIAECMVTYAGFDQPTVVAFVAIFNIRDGALSSERVYVTEHQLWIEEWRRSRG